MKKNKMGLHLDYDVHMGVGKCGDDPLSTLTLQGDYCVPIIAIGAVAAVCLTLTVARCVCFHARYKKR